MAFRAGRGVIDLAVNTSPLRGAAGAVKSAMRGIGGVALAGVAAATAGFTALTFAMKSALQAAAVQEKAEAKLKAVLRATGNAAGFTADQLFEQAKQMQANTTLGDEMIINTQAIIATFKNIRGDVFVSATSAIADMASVLDVDLKSAAIQVGKALNDPIQGIAALSRVGVAFTQDQKDMIKTLIETGDVMGAQQVILKELEGEFGGAAAAQAKTFGGQVIQLKNALGDMFEVVGAALQPILAPFIQNFKDLIPTIQGALIPAIKSMVESLKSNFDWIGKLVGGWKGFKNIISTSIVIMGSFGKVATIVVSTVAKGWLDMIDFIVGGLTRMVGMLLGVIAKLDIFDTGLKEIAEDLKNFEVAGDLRQGLGLVVDESINSIANSLADAMSSGIKKGAKDAVDAFDPIADKINASFGVSGGGKSKGNSIAGRFEGLGSLFKRIQGSAFKQKDPAVVATKETNTLLKENNKLTRENNAIQKQGFANLSVPGFIGG